MKNLPILSVISLGFHYPITTVILLWIGYSTTDANVLIKGLIAVMFLVGLVLIPPRQDNSRNVSMFLVIFLGIYGIRLFHDVLLQGILYGPSRTYILGYFFGLTLVPTLGIVFGIGRGDVKRLHDWMLAALILANLFLLLYVTTGGLLAAENAFGGRFEVEGEVTGTAIINPIMVASMGAILAAFALGRLAVLTHLRGWHHIAHMALVSLGGVNLLLGASRGPAVAFALCFLILLYTLVRGSVGATQLKTRASTWFYAAVVVAALVYLLSTRSDAFYLFDRLTMMFSDRGGGGMEERDFIYSQAWDDFLGSPVFGSSYVVSVGSALVHNFLLDALMSTGLVGAAFFVPATVFAVVGMIRMLHGAAGDYGYSIALAAVCFFIVGLTSGSVGQMPELWIFLALVTVLGNPVRRVAGRTEPAHAA